VLRRWLSARIKGNNALLLLALIVLVVAFTVSAPGTFLTLYNIQSIGFDGAGLLILSVGELYVIMTGGIDLSVGSVLIFSGVLAGRVIEAMNGASTSGWGVAVALLIGVLSGGCWGLLNGFLVAKAKIPPLIGTLGTLGAALGLADVITNGVDIRDIPLGLTTSLGTGEAFGAVPWLVVIAVIVAVIGGFFLRYTRFGRYTQAIGSNSKATRRTRVPVDRHLIKVYALAGLLSGLAGILSLARFSTTSLAGYSTENLAAITAVVLGGASLFGGSGSLIGTVIGVLIPTVLDSGLVIVGVSSYWQPVAVAAVLIVAVYFDHVRRSRHAPGS
jgi:ribose transport system permease protein